MHTYAGKCNNRAHNEMQKRNSVTAAADGVRRRKRKSTYDTCETYIEKGKKREEINRRIKLRIWSRMQNANGHGAAQTECNTIDSIAISD